jgi:hypothetical protein
LARGRAGSRAGASRSYPTVLAMFGLGLGMGALSLLLWNYFTGGMRVSLLSLLSPEGGQVYVAGIRIKHWVLGAWLVLAGALALRKSSAGAFLLGFGSALLLDELLTGDLW